MSLGTRDLDIIRGDLVKVTSNTNTKRNKHSIPPGTIASVSRIVPGNVARCQLTGYDDLYLNCCDLELVSYIRRGMM